MIVRINPFSALQDLGRRRFLAGTGAGNVGVIVDRIDAGDNGSAGGEVYIPIHQA
mgnify:CR=1 FL=1